jgi:hypothetical protein
MKILVFIIVGAISLMLLMIVGNRLLHNPRLSSRRFALILTLAFALLFFILILLSRPLDTGLIVVAFFISAVNVALGYPVLFSLHRFRSKREHTSSKDK